MSGAVEFVAESTVWLVRHGSGWTTGFGHPVDRGARGPEEIAGLDSVEIARGEDSGGQLVNRVDECCDGSACHVTVGAVGREAAEDQRTPAPPHGLQHDTQSPVTDVGEVPVGQSAAPWRG